MSDLERLGALIRRYEGAISARDAAKREIETATAAADAADEELVAVESELADWLDEAKALARDRARTQAAERHLGAEDGRL